MFKKQCKINFNLEKATLDTKKEPIDFMIEALLRTSNSLGQAKFIK